MPAFDFAVTQQVFAEVVGITQPAVSDLVTRGVLVAGETMGVWLRGYTAHLRSQVNTRDPNGRLAAERALLARAQRQGQELRNQAARRDYAPAEVLEAVLAIASSALYEEMAKLPAQIYEACPALPIAAREIIASTVASARAEWLRSTRTLSLEPPNTAVSIAAEDDDEPLAGDDDEVSP
ncbi:MAG: hypothetical protein Q8R33_00375 [Burkholderiales bacterium]|nr:hypothetical protein [Burkholderiales bacterium]